MYYFAAEHAYRADPAASHGAALPDTIEVLAKREVILSAGAFNTAQLLKLSGVGPAEELRANDIEVVADVPGVGENLQDRYKVGIVGKSRVDLRVLADCSEEALADKSSPG